MEIVSVSLPGAEETEPTTILEELNRNRIEPVVVVQSTQRPNENEQDVNTNDEHQVSDVGNNQLTECQSDVTDNVNIDKVQTNKLCDSDRNDGVEILNFNLQTIEDTDFDDKVGQAVEKSALKSDNDALVDSGELKGDSECAPSTSHENTGKFLREVSPPPVPLVTYRWEDVRRDKKKVRFDVVDFSFGVLSMFRLV